MATEPDQITEAVKRALDAAEAANFAAEDISRLSAAHRSFAEGVARGQKRSAALAGGAAVGALLGLALGGLVWFRSVADLREAGEVQATAAELLVEQVTRFKELLDTTEEREGKIAAKLDEMTAQVGRDLAKLGRSQQPMGAEVATTIREGVKEDVDAAKAEVLAALAAGPAAGAATESPEVKALLEELQTLAQGMAADRVATPAPTQAPAAAPKPAARPAARPAKPAEPDPFVYP
ncbi:hypothetical protein [Paragemmobacter straminiformis]|uniref:Uncharacterized protein n=1 Tax=Paragemmobacter straminiformis TaxID=2045119 RepID=A0A842I535_9RHOB|nr:hypothetical protein [Gemmobacter straminiformis]MBC2834766.1 hypothetical protein [Gemmobacter straminiformis]